MSQASGRASHTESQIADDQSEACRTVRDATERACIRAVCVTCAGGSMPDFIGGEFAHETGGLMRRWNLCSSDSLYRMIRKRNEGGA